MNHATSRVCRATLMCAAMVSVAWSSTAHAHVETRTTSGLPVHWTQPTVELSIDASFDDEVPGGSAAVAAALESWSGVGGAPTIVTRQGIGDARPAVDGKNIVYFAKDGYAAAGGALAVTLLSFDEVTGDIVDADIVVNGNYEFQMLPEDARHAAGAESLTMEGALGGAAHGAIFDLAHVVAHEGGHALGLKDEPSNASAVMFPYTFPGDASSRAPTADDAAGLGTLYASSSSAPMGGCGGATIAPRGRGARGDGLAALLVAFGFVGLNRARRRARPSAHLVE